MTRHASTLAIVPAYNEEKAIQNVVREIKALDIPIDVAVIDDGSEDQTADMAGKADAVVISLPYNLGIGGAVQTGFQYAVQKSYQTAVQVDGDGQHIPEEIPLLLKTMADEKVDVVIGSRFLGKGNFSSSIPRRLGIRIFQMVNSLFLRQKITDNTSGFRAYNQRAIAFLAEYYPHDYPEPESVILLKKNGFTMTEIPVRMRQREHGQSSISAFRAVYYMVKVLLAIFVGMFKKRFD